MEFVDVTYYYISSLINHHHSLSRQKVKEEKECECGLFCFDITYRVCKTGRERNPTCDKSYHCSPICSEAVVAIATLRVVEFEDLVFLVVDEVVI